MKATAIIECAACGKKLGKVTFDTAGDEVELHHKLDAIVQAHRQQCKYYRGPL